MGKTLSTVFQVSGGSDPSVFSVLPVRFLKFRRAAYLAVFEFHRPRFTNFLKGIHDTLCKTDGFPDNHIQHPFGQIPVTAKVAKGTVMELILEDKKDVLLVYFEVVQDGFAPKQDIDPILFNALEMKRS
jgi:hypothetical protein